MRDGGTDVNNNTNFSINSPDYKLSEGYPVLEQGANLSVTVSTARADNLDDYIQSDVLLKQIGKDFKTITLNGLPALQYRFSYEAVIAMDTVIIKNGKSYVLRYRYADQASQTKYLEQYQHMLDTFVVTQN